MPLDLKKAANKQNRADELIEQMVRAENLTSTTVNSLTAITPIEELPSEQETDNSTISVSQDKKGKFDAGLGLNKDGSYRQSNAGRKSKDESKKKIQMVLTLTPATVDKLKNHANGKSRSAPNYVSEFIENHLEEILRSF